MRFLIPVVLLLLSLSVFPQSERYNFSKLDIFSGLSHNQVNAILKDADGFLWFGTMSGLDRYVYDSHTEKFDADYDNYLRSLHLPPGPIRNIIKGNNGRYWFLYDNLDLYLYSNADKSVVLFKPDLTLNALEKIASLNETKDGKLWIVYRSGLLQQYDIKTKKLIFSASAVQKLSYESNAYNLFIDGDGDVWLWALNQGCLVFHPQNNSIKQFNENSVPSKLNANLVSQIVQDANGLIWVATDHGGVNLIDH